MKATPKILSSLRNLLKDKKLRYGGYATLLSTVVIAVVIALNVLVDQIPAKIDMTQRGYYSLSEQTVQILSKLEAPINIYGFFQTGQENTMLEELIRKYTVRSRQVNYRAVDPVRNPTFAKKYETADSTVGENSLVVESGERFKTLSQYDLYNLAYDQQTQTQEIQSQQFEAQITSAILYVTTADLPVVGTLTLHDEQELPYEVVKQLALENYTVRAVNLATDGGVPADVDVLVVNGPQRDLTTAEVELLRAYIATGGKLLVHMGLVQTEMKGWNDVLGAFGLAVRNQLVIEGDPRRHYAQVPMYLIPEMQSHDILSPLASSDMIVFLPLSIYIEELELKKRTTTVEKLLVTSADAFAKKSIDASTEINAAPGDPRGPFSLAVAASDRLDDEGTKFAKMVLVGNTEYLNSQLISAYPGNGNFLLNTVSWLHGQETTVSIRPKLLVNMRLFMSQQVALILSAIVAILIPLIAFGVGITVWLRRRHL